MLFTAFLLIAVVGFFFIRQNNNHEECTDEITYFINKDGAQVKTEKHLCKEKYPF